MYYYVNVLTCKSLTDQISDKMLEEILDLKKELKNY